MTEVEVLLPSDDIIRPDVLGRRRARCPERPTGSPVKVLPDWVCEVVSTGNANNDTVKKLRLHHHAGIRNDWLAAPRDATLTVMRWSEAGYITPLRADRHENPDPGAVRGHMPFRGQLVRGRRAGHLVDRPESLAPRRIDGGDLRDPATTHAQLDQSAAATSSCPVSRLGRSQ